MWHCRAGDAKGNSLSETHLGQNGHLGSGVLHRGILEKTLSLLVMSDTKFLTRSVFGGSAARVWAVCGFGRWWWRTEAGKSADPFWAGSASRPAVGASVALKEAILAVDLATPTDYPAGHRAGPELLLGCSKLPQTCQHATPSVGYCVGTMGNWGQCHTSVVILPF